MKSRKMIVFVAFLVVAIMVMSACGTSEFSVDCSDEKAAHVNADNAQKDAWVVTGSLSVEEGEQLVLTSNLEKGEVKIELFGVSEEQSIDELPETPEGEPVVMFMAKGTDSMSGGVAAGSYLIKATVTEKATGTVDITASAAK